MLLRPIVSRICKYQNFASLCSLKYVGPSLVNPEDEVSQEKTHVVSYLVNSCGFSPEKAISASKKVHFDSPDKPNAVLNFLEKHGFNKTQIAELVRRRPQVLVSNPEKSLLPKIQFVLQFTGIPETDVIWTFSRYPALWRSSLEHRLAPIFYYLNDMIGAQKVETLLRRGSWIFNLDLENRLIPKVDLLRELGVPQSCIELSLFHCWTIFWAKHDEFREVVEKVKQMGFDPSQFKFILAIRAITGKTNRALWDQCYETYSKWGWSKDDIHMAFKKYPNCMLLSEKKISTVLDFLVNKVGRESRLVAGFPCILFYNMEKRIVPRCSIVHLLSLEGLVKKDWSFSSVVCPREKDFLDKYVTRYNEKLPQLHDIYLSRKARIVEA